jgi:hypothetical protein
MMWYSRMSLRVESFSRASKGSGPLAPPRVASSLSKAASVGARSCEEGQMEGVKHRLWQEQLDSWLGLGGPRSHSNALLSC